MHRLESSKPLNRSWYVRSRIGSSLWLFFLFSLFFSLTFHFLHTLRVFACSGFLRLRNAVMTTDSFGGLRIKIRSSS